MTAGLTLARVNNVASGTLLDQVLFAQARATEALNGANIRSNAEMLVTHALSLGSPLLAPVSPMAERLVGAALVLGGDQVRALDVNARPPMNTPILLVEAVAARSDGLEWQRELLVRLGADRIFAVALDLVCEPDSEVHLLRR